MTDSVSENPPGYDEYIRNGGDSSGFKALEQTTMKNSSSSNRPAKVGNFKPIAIDDPTSRKSWSTGGATRTDEDNAVNVSP